MSRNNQSYQHTVTNNIGAEVLEQQNSYAEIRDHSLSLDEQSLEFSRGSAPPAINTLKADGPELTVEQARITEIQDPNNHVLVS